MPALHTEWTPGPKSEALGPSSRSLGFTLLEMLVVVTLLAIGLAIVTPSFRSFLDGQLVKGMAYDLTADLLLARSEALKRNATVQVRYSDSSWSSGWTTETVATRERIASRSANARTLDVSGAPASITFDVNGRVAAPAASVRMTITAPTGATRCVELDLSGRARSRLGACT